MGCVVVGEGGGGVEIVWVVVGGDWEDLMFFLLEFGEGSG